VVRVPSPFGARGRAGAIVGRLVAWVLIGVAASLLLSTFHDGIKRGDDIKANYRTLASFMVAACGLVSVEKYGTGRYVCASAAREEMEAAGLPVWEPLYYDLQKHPD
jgi:hypothetical protein